MGTLKEGRIEGLPESQCCGGVSGIGSPLVEKAGGSYIPGGEKRVAARQKSLHLNGREARLGGLYCWWLRGSGDWSRCHCCFSGLRDTHGLARGGRRFRR